MIRRRVRSVAPGAHSNLALRSRGAPEPHPPRHGRAAVAAPPAFCSDLGWTEPHVAGNSLGGWVALEIAKVGAASSVLAISPPGLWRARTPAARCEPRCSSTRGAS